MDMELLDEPGVDIEIDEHPEENAPLNFEEEGNGVDAVDD
jgi:hypothetical protein